MAESFKRDTPVLDFSPYRPATHSIYARREFILWPAYSYRIVAPRPRNRPLNLLQRAVLNLCRAGVRELEEMGKKLAIHRDLAAVVFLELENLALLTKTGAPTEKGLRTLAEDIDESYDMITGHVFQNPWGGELWPRFVDRLQYCEVEYKENGFPRLQRGARGNPASFEAYAVLPLECMSPKPKPPEIVDAVARHARASQHREELWEEEDEHDLELVPSFSGQSIQKVSFIEDTPSPVYLTTYLYSPKDAPSEWDVCDPFGLGVSQRLRGWIEDVMRKDNRLFEIVAGFAKSDIENGLEKHNLWLEKLRQVAVSSIEQRFSTEMRRHALFEPLVQMECAAQEALSLGENCPVYKLKSSLRSCLSTIEALFRAMEGGHPLNDVWKLVYVKRVNQNSGKEIWYPQREKRIVQAMYLQAAKDVGFDGPFPEAMLNTEPKVIKSVAEYGIFWKLRALVVATVFAAWNNPKHPLHTAAVRMPGMLREINEIANQGGKAGHSNDEKNTLEDLKSTRERTFNVVEVCFDSMEL